MKSIKQGWPLLENCLCLAFQLWPRCRFEDYVSGHDVHEEKIGLSHVCTVKCHIILRESFSNNTNKGQLIFQGIRAGRFPYYY